jgi:hypothetical protein
MRAPARVGHARSSVAALIAGVATSDGADLSVTAPDAATNRSSGSPEVLPSRSDGGVASCSASGWCWDNPLPQGNDLLEVWEVGNNGAVLRHY